MLKLCRVQPLSRTTRSTQRVRSAPYCHWRESPAESFTFFGPFSRRYFGQARARHFATSKDQKHKAERHYMTFLIDKKQLGMTRTNLPLRVICMRCVSVNEFLPKCVVFIFGGKASIFCEIFRKAWLLRKDILTRRWRMMQKTVDVQECYETWNISVCYCTKGMFSRMTEIKIN